MVPGLVLLLAGCVCLPDRDLLLRAREEYEYHKQRYAHLCAVAPGVNPEYVGCEVYRRDLTVLNADLELADRVIDSGRLPHTERSRIHADLARIRTD